MEANVVSELNRIQKELKAPKNQYNSFGKYKYRSCEDILEGIKKVLGDCCIVMNDSIEHIGDRFYVKSTATLIYKGETVVASGFAREAANKKGMDESQLTGATSSYARKYALNALFAIDDTKDSDYTNKGNEKPANKKPIKKIDYKAQENAFKSVCDLINRSWDKMSTDQRAELFYKLEIEGSADLKRLSVESLREKFSITNKYLEALNA